MALAEDIGFSAIDCGRLRSAHMIEGLGDFIRFMMGGMKPWFARNYLRQHNTSSSTTATWWAAAI